MCKHYLFCCCWILNSVFDESACLKLSGNERMPRMPEEGSSRIVQNSWFSWFRLFLCIKTNFLDYPELKQLVLCKTTNCFEWNEKVCFMQENHVVLWEKLVFLHKTNLSKQQKMLSCITPTFSTRKMVFLHKTNLFNKNNLFYAWKQSFVNEKGGFQNLSKTMI